MKRLVLLAALSGSSLLACFDKVILPLYCKTEGCTLYTKLGPLYGHALIRLAGGAKHAVCKVEL
jgi:hypothetical protein